jgi:16S rRNA (cytosine1402-N4)-methyltransferase
MDLGLSSRQLEDSHNRGFSYLEDEEALDMRMDEELGVTAKDLLTALSENELTEIFLKYGEEKYARKIAKAIKKENTNIILLEILQDLSIELCGSSSKF